MKRLNWIKWTAIMLVGLPVVAVTAFVAWFNADDHRATLEQLVAENSPLQLSINAPIEYSFRDPYLITFRQLSLSFDGETLLSLERFAIRIKQISLLRREITIEGISLDRPEINLSPARLDSLLNAFANQQPAPQPSTETEEAALILSALSLNNLNIDGLSLRWDDQNKPLRLKEMTLAVTDWQLIRDARLDFNHWQMAIYLTAEQLSWQQMNADNLALHAVLSDANIEIQDASLQIFSGTLRLAASTSFEQGLTTTIHQFTADDLVLTDTLFISEEADDEAAATESTAATEPSMAETPKTMIPVIATPLSSLQIEDFQINRLQFNSDTRVPGLALNNFSLAVKSAILIDNGQFSPAALTADIHSDFNELIWQQHKITDFNVAAKASKGLVNLTQLTAKLLDGDIRLSATTDLAQDLTTEIQLLQLNGLHIEDSLWSQSDAATPAPEPEKPIAHPAPAEVDQAADKLPIRALRIRQLIASDLHLAINATQPQIYTDNFGLELTELVLVQDYTAAAYPSILTQPFTLKVNSPHTKVANVNVHELVLRAEGGSPFRVNSLKSRSDYGEMHVTAEIQTQSTDLPFTGKIVGQQLELSSLDFLETGYPMSGKADLNATLSGSAASAEAVINSLSGPVQLRTEHFLLHNIDLDMTLNHFLDSQELTLTDIGAFALLGPIGLAVSKAKAISGAAAGALAGGDTQISQTDINMTFEQGVLKFGPSAIATEEHRIALFGKINLPEKRFELLRTAILDDKACVRLARSIDGPFSGPDVQVASAITGTVTGLLSGAFAGTDKFFGKNCEPVYTGAVKPPKQFDFDANASRLEAEQAALLKQLPAGAEQAEIEMRKAMQKIIDEVRAEEQK